LGNVARTIAFTPPPTRISRNVSLFPAPPKVSVALEAFSRQIVELQHGLEYDPGARLLPLRVEGAAQPEMHADQTRVGLECLFENRRGFRLPSLQQRPWP
jgi:hypothetical protein